MTGAKRRPAGPDPRAAAALVRAYLATLEPAARRALQRLRAVIRETIPGAAEGISYGIPVYKIGGRPVIYCAGWKAHVSLYPISEAFARAHGIDVSGYLLSTGTIRFPLDEPLPLRLVKRLVKARLAEAKADANKMEAKNEKKNA